MKDRKFDSARLYKLAKVLVIVITIISAAIAIYINGQKLWNSNEYYYTYNKTLFHVADECKKIYPNNEKDRTACFENAMKTWDEIDAWGSNSLKITILLPILFFGGTWLYKYLFPVKK